MTIALLALAFCLLTVPHVRLLVWAANRAGWGWDVLLVVVGLLAWFLGWGMVGAYVLVWIGD